MCTCEEPAIYRSTVVVCHKARRCNECHREITKGTQYHRATGLWDGKWDRFATCSYCFALASNVATKNPFDCCVNHGDLWDLLRECSLDLAPFWVELGSKTANKIKVRSFMVVIPLLRCQDS